MPRPWQVEEETPKEYVIFDPFVAAPVPPSYYKGGRIFRAPEFGVLENVLAVTAAGTRTRTANGFRTALGSTLVAGATAIALSAGTSSRTVAIALDQSCPC